MRPRVAISGYPRTIDTAFGATLLHTATRWYVDAVVRAGGVPFVLPTVEVDLVPDMLDHVDAVVLTGGGDIAPARYGETPVPETSGVDPLRDEFDLRLVHCCIERDVPLLAICRGMQVVNVALGGSLVQHVREHQHVDASGEPVHEVTIDPGSHLAEAVGVTTLKVNSIHHQAVARPAPGLDAVAWAPDGSVEAVEQPGNHHLVAVQWHPELMVDQPEQQGLFQQLVDRASARSSGAPRRSPRPG